MICVHTALVVSMCDNDAMKNDAIHIRLPNDMREAVQALATADDRSLLDMMRKLIKEALAHREASAPVTLTQEERDYLASVQAAQQTRQPTAATASPTAPQPRQATPHPTPATTRQVDVTPRFRLPKRDRPPL
jgi:hypothetical protein